MIGFRNLHSSFYKDYSWVPFLKNGKYTPQIPKHTLNIFTEFPILSVARHKTFNYLQSDVRKMIKNLFNNQDELVTYFDNWFAHKIQKPFQNPETCIALIGGKQGTGKGLLYKMIKQCIGREWCLKTSNTEPILGRFQCTLDKLLFCCLEEMKELGNAVKRNGRIKELVSAEYGKSEIKYESKGVDGLRFANYFCSYLFFSNELFSIAVDPSDRRYFVCQTVIDEKLRKKRKFWADCARALDDFSKVRCIFDYYAALDIENFNSRDIPETDVKKLLSCRNTPQIQLFIEWLFSYKENWLKPEGCNDFLPSDFDSLEKIPVNTSHENKIDLGVTWVFQRYKVFVAETNERKLRKQIVIPMFTNMLSGKISRITRNNNSRIDMVSIEKNKLKTFWETVIGMETNRCWLFPSKNNSNTVRDKTKHKRQKNTLDNYSHV